MEYRKSEEKDIPGLIRMRLAYLDEDYKGLSEEQVTVITKQLPGYFQEHLNKELQVYQCSNEEGDIISTVFLLVIEKPANPSFLTGKTGTILNVYTKPEYRRIGIAGKLLDMAIDDAKAMSLAFLELEATRDGEPLYRKHGFQSIVSHYEPMKYQIQL